jgi:hypothetical protein
MPPQDKEGGKSPSLSGVDALHTRVTVFSTLAL